MSSPFAGLVLEDKLGEVTREFEQAIAQSLRERPPMVSSRAAAVYDRFKKLERIFRTLRGDLHWSLPKIYDHMAGYLRDELDLKSWDPATGGGWTSHVDASLGDASDVHITP